MLFDFSGSRGVFVCSGIHSRHPGLFMAAFITLSVSRDARSEARVLVRRENERRRTSEQIVLMKGSGSRLESGRAFAVLPITEGRRKRCLSRRREIRKGGSRSPEEGQGLNGKKVAAYVMKRWREGLGGKINTE